MSNNNSNMYTCQEIAIKNNNSIWNNTISIVKTQKNNELYSLHPTGDADLNGRNYVALPKGTNVKDPKIIKKYNLI